MLALVDLILFCTGLNCIVLVAGALASFRSIVQLGGSCCCGAMATETELQGLPGVQAKELCAVHLYRKLHQ